MDEFKSKSLFHKNRFSEDNNPKKFGRRAARKLLKAQIPDLASEYDWWNWPLENTWDDMGDWWWIDENAELRGEIDFGPTSV